LVVIAHPHQTQAQRNGELPAVQNPLGQYRGDLVGYETAKHGAVTNGSQQCAHHIERSEIGEEQYRKSTHIAENVTTEVDLTTSLQTEATTQGLRGLTRVAEWRTRRRHAPQGGRHLERRVFHNVRICDVERFSFQRLLSEQKGRWESLLAHK